MTANHKAIDFELDRLKTKVLWLEKKAEKYENSASIWHDKYDEAQRKVVELTHEIIRQTRYIKGYTVSIDSRFYKYIQMMVISQTTRMMMLKAPNSLGEAAGQFRLACLKLIREILAVLMKRK